MKCLICKGSRFSNVVDLGMTPYADDFVSEARLNSPQITAPLRVVVCDRCDLVQLSYVAPREELYSNEYPYVSSVNKTGVKHYHQMASGIVSRFRLTGLAIDIGSNVGVLLEGFKEAGQSVIGIEPVPPIARTANMLGIPTINQFFSHALASEIVTSHGRAKYITGTNVVAHIEDLHDLARGLSMLLDSDGVFVFEAPYLIDLIDGLEYDTIYHEHLSYLSLRPVEYLFRSFGMQVFDIEHQTIHGGTMRYYISHERAHPVADIVRQTLQDEELVYDRATFYKFAKDVEQHRDELVDLLFSLKKSGCSIAAVSAPAKGMTLLNYCRIGRNVIDFVTERSETKIGRYTPGGLIPVVSDSELLARKPDYALLLAWNFAEDIMANNRAYHEDGGTFIVPIPHPRVVSNTTAKVTQ